MGQTIKVVCMFCKEKYGMKEGFGQSGVSHGICPKCESAEKCPKCGFPLKYCVENQTCKNEGRK